jgi:hypothetical protein
LGRETRVSLGIGGHNRLAAFSHLAQHGPAHLESGVVERLAVHISGDAKLQLATLVLKHQKAALGAGKADDGIHHLV